MKSIRESVFESNSSSCHSMTIAKCPVQDIIDFNNGSKVYVCMQKNYKDGPGDGFYTLEEVAKKLIQDIQDVDAYQISWYQFGGDDIVNVWTSSDSDVEDFENVMNWLKQNLSVEMFCWAFDEKYKRTSIPFISRKILQGLLRAVIESVWNSPLLLREDLPFGPGQVTSIYGTGDSDVEVNKETGELYIYESLKDKSEVCVELEFRD